MKRRRHRRKANAEVNLGFQIAPMIDVAHMNADALRLTLETGTAHFWSRSRAKLWKKGEESGNLLKIKDIRTDCDQDVLLIAVEVQGDGVACHTGAKTCFYRRLSIKPGADGKVALEPVAAQKSRER